MPATPTYGLRWPLSTDTPDVPRDVQALAEDTEAGLRRHGAVATATAAVRNQPVGPLVVTLSNLSQEGGYTLSGGRITVPCDGRYLVVCTADFTTEEVTVWVGTGQSAKVGVDLRGATIFWEGQYVFTQKLRGRGPDHRTRHRRITQHLRL